MFATIEAAILRVLRDHLTTVPPDNVQATSTRGGRVPAVTLVNVDFVVKEVGFGRSGGGVELQDTFHGDGVTVAFALRVKPLRPILAVEAPPGTRVPVDDYVVDYEEGLVTFHAPPPAADAIVVRYLKPTQVKGVKLDLRYHLTVWGADEAERDALTVAAMEALLREEEALARQGVLLTGPGLHGSPRRRGVGGRVGADPRVPGGGASGSGGAPAPHREDRDSPRVSAPALCPFSRRLVEGTVSFPRLGTEGRARVTSRGSRGARDLVFYRLGRASGSAGQGVGVLVGGVGGDIVLDGAAEGPLGRPA